MSMFENDAYRWRETYFVVFDESNRPSGEALVGALKQVNEAYEFDQLQVDEAGNFQSVSILSTDDYAAMDVIYLTGEEVSEHCEELVEDMLPLIPDDDAEKLKSLPQFNARLDVFHFEQVIAGGGDEEEEFLDPGSLLIVLETLAHLTVGVGVDQESGTLL